KLWNNCKEVSLEKAKSYLFTVATNLQISLKRHEQVKLKYKERVMMTSSVEKSESPEEVLLGKEYMDKLMGAISSLPEKQRETFLLNRVEKKTYREIAEISGVSVKAIEKLMHKALSKLRKEIGDV
ncbi:MAG: sigma-70 family RNA polymerase sigma factor, partial [Bacteroidota bacterium]